MVCVWFWVFLFKVCGTHRDLHVLPHSFPTRRASELSGGIQACRVPGARASRPPLYGDHPPPFTRAPKKAGRRPALRTLSRPRRPSGLAVATAAGRLDDEIGRAHV